MASRKDVTNDTRYWGEYKPDEELLLVADVYLQKKYNNLIPEKYYNNTSSKKNLDFSWPSNFDEYLKTPEQYPEFAILRKGIIVKCAKIYFVDNVSWSTIDISGIISTGDFKDTNVSLRFLSIAANDSPEGGVYCLKPNPSYLKLLEKK